MNGQRREKKLRVRKAAYSGPNSDLVLSPTGRIIKLSLLFTFPKFVDRGKK